MNASNNDIFLPSHFFTNSESSSTVYRSSTISTTVSNQYDITILPNNNTWVMRFIRIDAFKTNSATLS